MSEKTVIIMRGLSGSGKSTWLQNNYPTALVCSADSYFVDKSGEYKFDPDKITLAHDHCLKKSLAYIASDKPLVAVDNTHMSLWEVSPYYNLARAFGYQIKVVRCFCTPETAIARNIHETPEDVIYGQYSRFQPGLPWWKEQVVITDRE